MAAQPRAQLVAVDSRAPDPDEVAMALYVGALGVLGAQVLLIAVAHLFGI